MAPERVVNTWRSIWPASALREAGHHAVAVGQDAKHKLRTKRGDTLVIHASNQYPGLGPFVRRLKGFAGVIVQWDDSYLDLGDIQDVNGQWYRTLREDTIMAARAADRVIVSTPYLAERMGRYAMDVRVVPNYIARWVTEMELPERVYGPTWLGWLGLSKPGDEYQGSAHAHDWRWLTDAGVRLPPVYIVGSGGVSDAMWYHAHGVAVARHQRGTVVQEDFYRMVARGRLGIAPVDPSLPFNRAKSWIKPLEYAALGMPSVVGPIEEYRRIAAYLPGIQVADYPGDFPDLLNDPYLSARTWAPRSLVAQRMSVEAQVGEWERALELRKSSLILP